MSSFYFNTPKILSDLNSRVNKLLRNALFVNYLYLPRDLPRRPWRQVE